MNDAIIPPVGSADDLFDSVMTEFKHRIKVVPQQTKESDSESLEKELTKPLDINSNLNGIAEYAAYCRNPGHADTDDQYNTLPARTLLVNQGNGLVHVPLSPPAKPKRRNQPDNGKKETNRSSGLDKSRMSSELQEIIDSAFSSEDKSRNELFLAEDGSISSSHATPQKRSIHPTGYLNNTKPLSRENLDNVSKFLRNSIDSGLDDGSKLSRIPFIDDNAAFDDDPNFLCTGEAFEDDAHFETLSVYSVLSDEGSQPNGWFGSEGWREERAYEDSISLSSFTSADATLEVKKTGVVKRINARERAKILKKQAAVQKEKMGALLDAAASNASDKIRKLRKPSIKFPHAKHKKLQTLANMISHKNNDLPAINISAPTILQENGNAFDDDEAGKKPLPPLREASLASPNGRVDAQETIQQVGIKSGYLKKQSGGKIRTWNERFFVLRGDQLHYYKDVEGKLLASIFLPGSKITTHPVRANDTHKFTFEIFPGDDRAKMNNNHESYVLSASSPTDMEEWVKVIRRVIFSPFGGGIFGQRLDETMRYDSRQEHAAVGTDTATAGSHCRNPPRQVPIIVENCVEFIRSNNGLKEEGLFRLPGHANEVKELQDSYDMGERPVFPSSTDVHTVASLLKGYLRELPEPVIPFDRYDQLIYAAKLSQSDEGGKQTSTNDVELSNQKEQARKIIKDQLNLLPQANFDLLRYLCRFLDEVQQHSAHNKMDISNLAMVFSPNIMRAKQEDALTMMADATNVQHVMYQFIANHMYFFPDDDQCASSTLQSVPVATGDTLTRSLEDVAQNGDTGIGTLTTTASPLGTLGMRHATDDSGTGSMGPTPENTNKRIPPIPTVPPPLRNKPNKPMRRKLSAQHINGEPLMLPSSSDRKSYYDNVTASSATGNDTDSSKFVSSQASPGRGHSNGNAEAYIEQSSTATGQASYHVNNRSTPGDSPRSSTHAVAGSVGRPDSCHSSPVEDGGSPRYRGGMRPRRVKPSRHVSQNITDEESNTESVLPEDRAFSTLSSLRSEVPDHTDSFNIINHPRSSSYPVEKYTSGKSGAHVSKEVGRLSGEIASDDINSASFVPAVPTRNHRNIRKEEESQTFGSGHNSNSDLYRNGNGNVLSERSSNFTSTTASVGGQSTSFKEMQEEIRMLREELQKQRLEHEKRSRMLEEHYIMKMRTSASALAPFTGTSTMYPPAPSIASQPHPSLSSVTEDLLVSPSSSNPFQRASIADESMLDPNEVAVLGGNPQLVRTMSIDSQAEFKYREEVRRHAITKIRLRNVERGLQQADERNMQLQKEMEAFFETFGGMLSEGQL